MRKYLLLTTFLVSFCASSQFNSSAPWMQNLGAKNGSATLEEMKTSFDNYWLTHDKNVKGSGYKPFMRWVHQKENHRNPDGSFITNEQLQKVINDKRKLQNRSSFSSTSISNWQPVGPFSFTNTGSWSSGKGRLQCIAIDPNNQNIIYFGTPASGIWKSTDAGVNFVNISDQLPQNGVSGIAIDPNNTNIIYIATGDSDGGNTQSIGVLKSTDGGANWTTTGLNAASANLTRDIIINPNNSQILLCATSSGVFKTVDGGANWVNTQTGNFSGGALRFKPNDPTTVYVSSSDGIFKSTNGGDSFTEITTGLPTTLGRTLIDVTPIDSDIVYAAIGFANGINIYKSTDSGLSFTFVGVSNVDEHQQIWFNLALAVSPTNANEIYTGTLNIWKSTNGGVLFERLNSWSAPFSANYTHADIHHLKFFGNKLACSSDGGIYISDNQGTSFTDLTTSAQIGQFYKVAVSKQSAGKMVGGLQDNGGFGYSSNSWKNYYGADGMDTAIDQNNNNLYYGFIQNGSILYISNNAANSLTTSVPQPPSEVGNWVTPLAINSVGEVFAGYAYLHKLVGTGWINQSNSAVGTGSIDELVIDPSNDDNMWVATDKKLFKSTNRGQNFSNVFTTTNNIVSICVNRNNSNIIYLVTAGSNGQVLKSVDGGLNFTDISAGLPAIGKNCIKHQGRHTNNPLYVATQLGVYYLDDTLTTWVPFETNLPNIQVTDLEINLEDSKIIAATYGRGIWESPIANQIPLTDLKLTEILEPTTTVGCASINPVIVVKNNGQNTISTVSVNYTINSTPYSHIWTGTLLSLASTNITLPTISLPRGSYILQVTSTTINDAFADNNSLSTPFYINNSGTTSVINTFESSTTELITYGDVANNTWLRGQRVGSALGTGSNSVYASNLTGNYSDGKKAYLVSQCYDLTTITNPEIRFKMAYDLEQNYDLVYVQYSTNNGTNWNSLGNMNPNWYNSDRTSVNIAGDCQNCVGAQWTGTNTTMTEYFYPLNSLGTNTNIIFRIVFHSDEGVNGLGVIVDDFVINGTLANEQFELKNVAIYPNPSTGIFYISKGNIDLKCLEVTDISGKIILKQTQFQDNNSEILLNLSSISKGVYFIKLTSEESSIIKKIIKN